MPAREKTADKTVPNSGAKPCHKDGHPMEEAMRTIVLASAFALPFLAASANAEEPERYRLEKSDTGYVRMDTKTGEMSICEERAGQLVCKLAADERSAFQDEVDRLRTDLKTLEERVAKLEKPGLPLLSDEEFDRTMGYMEKFVRGFMGIVKDLEKDNGTGSREPLPQKT
jgi:hypothetical protein